MNRKVKNTAQFDTMIIKEKDSNGVEKKKTITNQKTIEWEVRKFYWTLYRKQEVDINKDELIEMTGHIKKISEVEKTELEKKITLKEVNNSLRNTRINVAPGTGRFSGAFYKVFLCYMKKVVQGAIQKIHSQLDITDSAGDTL